MIAVGRKGDRAIANCGGGFGWYDAVPGKTYSVALDLCAASGGQQMQLTCDVVDRDRKQTAHLEAEPVQLTDGDQIGHAQFKIPPLKEAASLYSDLSSDDWFAMKIGAVFTKLQGGRDIGARDIFLRPFAITQADAVEGAGTENAGVRADGREYIHAPALKPDQFATLDLPPLDHARGGPEPVEGPPLAPARSVYEISARGNGRCTWLVRQTGLKWQVRNAPAADHGDCFEVGPLRNRFSAAKEIVIVPLVRTGTPFVHKLRNANRARLYPFAEKGAQLKAEVLEALGPVEIEVRGDRRPRSVTGADHWEFQDGRVHLKVGGPGTILLEF